MQVYVGLDGGGSGSRAQAELSNGLRTEIVIGGPANVFSDHDTALRVIIALLHKTLAAARYMAPASDMDSATIVLGLAGASEAGPQEKRALLAALPFADLQILGDIDIAVGGALHDHDGIVVAVGTGSVLARQTGGQIARIGGHGFVLGDEGGGAWMGRRALQLALHAHDDLVPRAPLSDEIWHRYQSVAEVLAFARAAGPADFATLAPMVLAQDAQGCPQASSILDDACIYLQRAVRTLQGPQENLPVIGTGGLGPALMDRLISRLMPDLPRAEAKGTALDGALWRARNPARTHAKDQPT